VAVYPYTDKGGNLVARICRYEEEPDETGAVPKHFPIDSLLIPEPPPWDAWDDRKDVKPERGGWIHHAPPIAQRPLYRLKELLDASIDTIIYLTEGEKDADTCVNRWGLTATTVMCGAANWWGTYALFFEGRHVVILIDNDDKGRERGEFQRRLLGRVAAKVDVVMPPTGKLKGDITDWANQNPNATAADVRKMCSDNWQPPLDREKDANLLVEVKKMQWALWRREGWKDIDWAKHRPMTNVLNCSTALDLLEVGVRYDEFNKKLYTSNTGDRIFDDVEVVDELTLHLSKRISLVWTTEFSMAALREEIALRAKHNTFHPVQEKLNGLSWDGTKRVANWLPTYLGVTVTDDNREYICAVGEMFLLQMVARIYQPGCNADYVLILEGPQGRKKSTALEVLAGEDWFSDDLPPLTEKDAKLHLRGKWLVELGEIKRTLRVDPDTFKAFQTREVDRYRPPYGRTDIDQPRQCVFAGTVNSAEYFTDETGNRRGWPITCGTIDIEKLREDRDQLFAETVVLYNQGKHWWPNADFEEQHFVPQQEVRQIETAFDQYVQRILRRCDDERRVTLDFVAGLAKGKYPHFKDYLLPRAIRNAGWKAEKGKLPGTQRTQRYWVRTEKAEPYVPQTGTDPEDEYAKEVQKAVDKDEAW
jgi:hypothetical protein